MHEARVCYRIADESIFNSDAKKLKTLHMYKDGKAQRNSAGKITKAASYQSRETQKARIEPNRKWFGNTRVIAQDALDSFREAMVQRASDPYQVLLKTNKIPLSLIRDGAGKNGVKEHQAKIAVEAAPFGATFGPKAQRKRVKLGVSTLEDLAGETEKANDSYLETQEQQTLLNGNGQKDVQIDDDSPADETISTAREPIFSKGQSKRIFNELYKVLDSSDVVIHVLDARDPLGTRCRSVEQYIREEAPHKHLVFVLNKCDLVPTRVAVSFTVSFLAFSHLFRLYLEEFLHYSVKTPSCIHLHLLRGRTVCYNFGRLISCSLTSILLGREDTFLSLGCVDRVENELILS